MKSKHFRHSNHPLTMVIDRCVDAREAAGHPVSRGLVTSDLTSTVPAVVMLSEFQRLVGPKVTARLKARGYLVTDTLTWERTVDMDVTDIEFHYTVDIKAAHLSAVQARLKADRDVAKFLDAQATKLGRPVTMGEFEKQIDAIYDRHGF
jgi:hypothetical protein